jgi:cystathionine beta-lyase
MPGHKFVPTLSINDWAKSHVITATAISKTFNTAGLVASYHIIMDKYLRDRITLYGENTHYNEMNVFSEHALIAAYSEEGEAWLGELITVLNDNLSYVVDYIHKNFDGVSVTMPEGTYMLFIDFDDWLKSHGVAQNELLKKFHEVGVGVQDGRQFRGNTSIRMNTALPKSLLIEAMKRMNEVLNAFD